MNLSDKIRIYRERFFGRQDVYGRKWTKRQDDGEIIKGYAPVCSNLWKPGCHIRLKDGISCTNCEIREYNPVSDETVMKHITGQEEHLHYIVHPDGMAYFAAFDFDQKPGKEKQGHNWNDVKITSQILSELGIPHIIARSTGTEHLYGHHLYMFMSEPYPALKLRAISFYIMERCGFMEEMRNGVRPLPEFFPKQDYTDGFGIGNGIKPPMCENNFPKGRNGFVTGEDEFIHPDQQWEYLANAPRVDVSILNKIIEDNDLKVDEMKAATGKNSRAAHMGPGKSPNRGDWQQPLNGSYEKVVEGCKAIRRVFEKAAKGEAPSHHEGFAAYHIAMRTRDGIEYFRRNATGWAQTDKDLKQLEHSLNKDYAPWTCKKMQEHGVCVPGTKCFEKKPPLIMVEGNLVVADDIPADQWPDPSPIRYAFGEGLDFLDKLKQEIELIDKNADENVKGRIIRGIAKRSQAFDDDQIRELKEFIKAKKLLKWPDISKMFTKAVEEHAKETKELAATRSDTVLVGDNCYKYQTDPIGYELLKKQKSGNTWMRIADFHIEINEEREYLDDDQIMRSLFVGTFKAKNYEKTFEIPRDDWNENKEFTRFFGRLVGSHFCLMRQDLDHLRIASQGFSKKFGIEKRFLLATQGWHEGAYLMPSVLVDVAGIRPNTDKEVSLDLKPHSSSLDFKIVPEDELRRILFHIKGKFLNAWPRKWTMTCLAHGLLPAVVSPLKIRKKPALFLEGLTGSGKTEILHTIQFFWGLFESIVNLSSTGKGMMAVAHDFKDALLVFDDYKGLNRAQTASLQTVIQYSYDPNKAVKLSKDSSILPPKTTRGVIAFTGEHFISNDSAMVARTILLEVDKQDTTKTRDAYSEVIEERENYNAVTPYFIHWLLQQDLKSIKELFLEFQKDFYAQIPSGRVNADRVSYNLSLNHVLWRLFVDFMYSLNMVDDTERASLCNEHLGYALEIQNDMIQRCSDEQTGNAFLRVLVQLISSGEAIIEGLNDEYDGDAFKRGTVIGFMNQDQGAGPKIVNIFPDVAVRLVKRASMESPIRGNERDFSRQFADMGKLIPAGQGRLKHQIRYKNARPYVWQIYADMLEVEENVFDTRKAVGGDQNIVQFPNKNEPPMY